MLPQSSPRHKPRLYAQLQRVAQPGGSPPRALIPRSGYDVGLGATPDETVNLDIVADGGAWSMAKDSNSERFHRKREEEERYQQQLPGEDDVPLPPPVEPVKAEQKPKRNDPCPCGSGKKYKQCCGKSA
jgi:hypothetical protein